MAHYRSADVSAWALVAEQCSGSCYRCPGLQTDPAKTLAEVPNCGRQTPRASSEGESRAAPQEMSWEGVDHRAVTWRARRLSFALLPLRPASRPLKSAFDGPALAAVTPWSLSGSNWVPLDDVVTVQWHSQICLLQVSFFTKQTWMCRGKPGAFASQTGFAKCVPGKEIQGLSGAVCPSFVRAARFHEPLSTAEGRINESHKLGIANHGVL